MLYQRARKNPKQFLAVTGLTISEFDYLLEHFDYQWNKLYKKKTRKGKVRLNKYKSSRGALPSTADKLFFLLFYYKNNLLQYTLALCFNLNQSQINKEIMSSEKILLSTLKKLDFLPVRDTKELYQLILKQKEKCLLLDGVERTVTRSIDYQTQKDFFSGKKNYIQSKIT